MLRLSAIMILCLQMHLMLLSNQNKYRIEKESISKRFEIRPRSPAMSTQANVLRKQ